MKTAAPSILVVDDNPSNLELLRGILDDRGYDVRVVPGGGMALTSARADPPDLMLLDIKMPDLNGYEVCRQLKADEATKEIPVLFISAAQEPADVVESLLGRWCGLHHEADSSRGSGGQRRNPPGTEPHACGPGNSGRGADRRTGKGE